MTIYTKTSGVALDENELLTFLKDFLILNGYNLELFSDNITTDLGYNLGKRLHMSKNSVFYNFASNLNNSTSSNNSNYTSRSISEIACNTSLTFNSSIDWFKNNVNEEISRAEIKENCNYFFYVNDKNIIIVIKYATNKYTFLSIGESNSYSSNKIIFQTGTSTTSFLTDRIKTVPLFSRSRTSYFINSTYYNFNNSRSSLNHYNTLSNEHANFNVDITNSNKGLVNRSDNIFNGTSLLMPFVYYARLTFPVSSRYTPIFTIKNIFAVNFKNMTPEQNLEIGTNKYDVFPFFQKESPQIYSNDENFGMGIAIKVGE